MHRPKIIAKVNQHSYSVGSMEIARNSMIRIFDFLLSFIGVVVLMPFLLPVVLVLLLTGEHKVFYLQKRVGRDAVEFNLIKFATMLMNSPQMKGGFITQENDPRVLPVGRFLRKTKINELPQLINVLFGQMSLVGPRPLVVEQLDNYSVQAREAILKMRPGLTGIASLVFRDEEGILNSMPGDRNTNHARLVSPYKGELERWFFENRSIGLYFSIIFWTVVRVLFPGLKAIGPRYKGLPEVPVVLKPYI